MSQKIKKSGCLLFVLIGSCLSITAVTLLTQIWILPSQANVTTTLTQMYEDDQAIRASGLDSPANLARFLLGDWIRVNKTRRIVDADLLTTAEDYANAARILQHGNRAEDYLTAQNLSLTAYDLGDLSMLRHSALAEDRYLIAIGKPQKYGTQFKCSGDDGWQLSPIDPAISDDGRRQMDIEPLAELDAKMIELNEATNATCTLDSDTMRLVETIMGE